MKEEDGEGVNDYFGRFQTNFLNTSPIPSFTRSWYRRVVYPLVGTLSAGPVSHHGHDSLALEWALAGADIACVGDKQALQTRCTHNDCSQTRSTAGPISTWMQMRHFRCLNCEKMAANTKKLKKTYVDKAKKWVYASDVEGIK